MDEDASSLPHEKFVPAGEELLTYHPLYKAQATCQPHWILSERNGVEYELYWKGSILICSKGGQSKVLVRSLTIDQPIREALITSMCDEMDEEEDYIVILSEVDLHLFSFTGHDYTRALPFHPVTVWALHPGLLLQNKSQMTEDKSIVAVTLCNPLDNFTPLGREQDSSDMMEPSSTIVCVLNDPVIIAAVSSSSRKHLALWRLNKKAHSDHELPSPVPPDEIEDLKAKLGFTLFTPNLQRANTTKLCISRDFNPKQGLHIINRTRVNSERSSFINTPTPPNVSADGRPYCSISQPSVFQFEEQFVLPIEPDFIITKMWGDPQPCSSTKSVKCLRGETFSGEKYFGLLNNATGVLKCVLMTSEGGMSKDSFNIPAVDGCYLDGPKVLVILDSLGRLYLYNGKYKLCQVSAFSSVDTSEQHASKKARRRCSRETLTPNQFSDVLSSSFSLTIAGEVIRCQVPWVTPTSPVSTYLTALTSTLSSDHSACFFSLFFSAFLSSKGRDWNVFVECVNNFTGVSPAALSPNRSDSSQCITQYSSEVRRTRHSQINEDWEYLLNMRREDITSGSYGLTPLRDLTIKDSVAPSPRTSEKAELMLPILHALYEECKLNLAPHTEGLAALAHNTAMFSGNVRYQRYFSSEYPHLQSAESSGPPVNNIMSWLVALLAGQEVAPVPLIPGVTLRTEAVVILFLLLRGLPLDKDKYFQYLGRGTSRVELVMQDAYTAVHDQILAALVALNITLPVLQSLPNCIQLPILDVLYQCHCQPPSGLPAQAYQLIHRNDVISTVEPGFMQCEEVKGESDLSFKSPILDLRFPEDNRVAKVAHMFSSSQPVKIVVERTSVMTDPEYIDQQELLLFNKTKRTMSLPVGKALFLFGTHKPSPTQPIVIPDVCIAGKALPRGNTVNLDLDIPPDMTHWTEFHSGVATGLRIDPSISEIDYQWIVYNRPQELNNKHAGFLLALGLTGHLKKLSSRNVHDYLCQRHKFTSIGLLLGLGVAYIGTMNETSTKLFSIHIPALLPPTAVPLELDHLVQTSAIAGLGLIYMGTAHRRMAEILLEEIARCPGPEMDNAEDREGYSLVAGFSLGLVLLGQGNDNLPGLDDLKLTDRLYKYINGGKKKSGAVPQPSSFRLTGSISRIWEGNMTNTNVSAIGAIMALGLTFLKTGNRNVARTLTAPHTEFLLDGVRPDMLLLRTTCHGLIMWDEVMPTTDWVIAQIPEVLLDCLDQLTGVSDDPTGINLTVDPDTAFPSTLTIIAGSCFALGLRFAGTGNKPAFTTVLFYLNTVHKISRNPSEYAGFSKDLTEMCLVSLLLSACLIMAGSGNLVLVRLIRKLRRRFVPVNAFGHNYVTYGCHMGIHMALGLLFLGGGRYSLRRDNDAIAALFISMYPLFQTCQDDNTYHLQALRHLWVIAAQPRLLIAVDEDTREACYVPVTLSTRPDCIDTTCSKPSPTLHRTVFTPVMLPDFSLIEKVTVCGDRYWPVVITDVSKLKSGFIFVKKRTGLLEYKDDPEGKINLLARTFGNHIDTNITESIKSFSKNERIVLFVELFCSSLQPSESSDFCKQHLLECVLDDKSHLLPFFLTLYKTEKLLMEFPSPRLLEEIRVLIGYYANKKSKLVTSKTLAKLQYSTQHALQQLNEDSTKHLVTQSKDCSKAKFFTLQEQDPVLADMMESLYMKDGVSAESLAQFQLLVSLEGY